MKLVLFVCGLIVAAATALPSVDVSEVQSTKERNITDRIRNIIEQLRDAIRNGYDPYIIVTKEYEYNSLLVNVKAFIHNLSIVGGSNININKLSYSNLLRKLRFDIELADITFNVANSGAELNIINTKYNNELRGSLIVKGVALSGEASFKGGLLSGLSLSNLQTQFRIQHITSNINLIVMNSNLSDVVNKFFNEDVQTYMKTFEKSINAFIADLIWSILEKNISVIDYQIDN